MKKLIFTAFAAILISFSASAQSVRPVSEFDSYKNEVSVGYGIVTLPEILQAFSGLFGTMFTGGLAVADEIYSTGAFHAQYYHYVSPMFGFGGQISGESVGYSFETMNLSTREYEQGDMHHNVYLSLMPSAKGRWLRRPHFCLYSSLSLGVCLDILDAYSDGDKDYDAETNVIFAAQSCPVGIEFGGVRHRGFLEMGFGMTGFISGGYKFAF
ncbi:MAG: hypothetical protein K5984_06635 [Bacteroidales bacterium]|nr:hypothetical protein [Bacteroidales bacterium]